jgi:hypothetical protein
LKSSRRFYSVQRTWWEIRYGGLSIDAYPDLTSTFLLKRRRIFHCRKGRAHNPAHRESKWNNPRCDQRVAWM